MPKILRITALNECGYTSDTIYSLHVRVSAIIKE
jgi:hypothetical protein